MALATFAFLVIFLLISTGGLLLFHREEMLQRISDVVTPQSRQTGIRNTIQQTGFSLSGLVGQAERILPKSRAEVSVVKQRMIRAGYRKEAVINIFYGAKVLVPLVLCFLVLVTGIARHSPFFFYASALVLGFMAPDFWLGRRIASRQRKIRLGLPDVLDLLVICVEAGLGLDQATERTTEELRVAHPAMHDEMSIIVLEQRAGRPRSETWENFAVRTGVDSVRNLVSVLAQSEQYGTSIARTLRVHADTLRTQRRQRIEEQAAKTTVKLIFPLVLFIFPSLFVVTLGPAVIVMSESFNKFFTQ
jgi:tight adherence protein C